MIHTETENKNTGLACVGESLTVYDHNEHSTFSTEVGGVQQLN